MALNILAHKIVSLCMLLFRVPEINSKRIIYMTLEAVSFCHSHNVLPFGLLFSAYNFDTGRIFVQYIHIGSCLDTRCIVLIQRIYTCTLFMQILVARLCEIWS